jgi:2,4-dienoyl-CoA reductase-like NADH-dependent reductase (Old Yellow Enzyme family)
VKLNSADHQSPTGLKEGLEQIELINAEKIDFLEISGGTYEDPKVRPTATKICSQLKQPQMLQSAAYAPEKKASTIQREAFFLDFAKIIRESFPNLILMVTGGFRTRGAMEDAVMTGACDLIGLARPAAAAPRLPKEVILNEKVEDSEARIWLKPVAIPAVLKMLPLKNLTAGNETVCVSSPDVSAAVVLHADTDMLR